MAGAVRGQAEAVGRAGEEAVVAGRAAQGQGGILEPRDPSYSCLNTFI